jgi:Holliday junction resolvasome RuvABC ATP-dependent DNA helicase subunit
MTPAVLSVLEFFGNLTISLCRFSHKTAGLMGGVLNANTRKAFKWLKSRRSSNNARKENLSRPTQALSEIPGKKLIGQRRVQEQIEHYLSGLKNPNTCRFHILLVGPKGVGKSEFARQNLKRFANRSSSWHEINCATIKSIEGFYEHVYVPYIRNKEVTMFFDEAHNLPEDVSNLFCTIFNNERGHTRKIQGGDGKDYEFDFLKHTFVFATTQPDKLYDPFQERLSEIYFTDYTTDELEEIIKSECEKTIILEEGVPLALAERCQNPRQAVKLSKQIQAYMHKRAENVFKQDHIDGFFDIFEIYPLGLGPSELRYLKILNRGPASLKELAFKTDENKTVLLYETEKFLVKNDLIKIDRKREITDEGRQYLRENLASDAYEVPTHDEE